MRLLSTVLEGLFVSTVTAAVGIIGQEEDQYVFSGDGDGRKAFIIKEAAQEGARSRILQRPVSPLSSTWPSRKYSRASGMGTRDRSLGSRHTFIKQVGLLGREAETVSNRETRLWFWVESLNPTEASVPSSHVQCGHSLRSGDDFGKGAQATDPQVHLEEVAFENNE